MIEPIASARPLHPIRLLVLVLAISLNAACARPREREILIVAKGMAFTLPADPVVANPVIQLHPGERIRLVLKNEAPGLIHNFEVPSWGIKLPNIRNGESADIEFTVPPTPGQFEYICGPHSELMKGVVEVTLP